MCSDGGLLKNQSISDHIVFRVLIGDMSRAGRYEYLKGSRRYSGKTLALK